jgi:hypothetical protein
MLSVIAEHIEVFEVNPIIWYMHRFSTTNCSESIPKFCFSRNVIKTKFSILLELNLFDVIFHDDNKNLSKKQVRQVAQCSRKMTLANTNIELNFYFSVLASVFLCIQLIQQLECVFLSHWATWMKLARGTEGSSHAAREFQHQRGAFQSRRSSQNQATWVSISSSTSADGSARRAELVDISPSRTVCVPAAARSCLSDISMFTRELPVMVPASERARRRCGGGNHWWLPCHSAGTCVVCSMFSIPIKRVHVCNIRAAPCVRARGPEPISHTLRPLDWATCAQRAPATE